MNIKISYNWLLEFLDTNAGPYDMQKCLSLCGPSIERVDKTPDGDYVFDVEITSNRIDMASVQGIAREAVAILPRYGFNAQLKTQTSYPLPSPTTKLPFIVEDNNNLCKRIVGIVMRGVQVGPSPAFISDRLVKSGMKSLNNLIDITNYLMLELGQPLHVFDYDRVKTAHFIVRAAKRGETLVTLDGKTCSLLEEDVIIDDGTGRIIDLPGIMGTENSVVTQETKNIILFTESNNPVSTRRTSMRLNLRTLAATINEKSPDPEQSMATVKKAIFLYQKYAHAQAAGNVVDIYPRPSRQTTISVDTNFIVQRLGVKLAVKEMIAILEDLGFTVRRKSPTDLLVTVPSYRVGDVHISEDIVEEIARIYGYHNFPNNLPPCAYVRQPKEMEDLFVFQNKIKTYLKHIGLNEVLNYSMISKELIEKLGMKTSDHLSLANAMSEEIRYLRISLLPSLMKNIQENRGRRDTLQLFELAKVYLPRKNDLPDEQYKLGIALIGSFSELKGCIESLLSELNIETFSFERSSTSYFSKNEQARVKISGEELGTLGVLGRLGKLGKEDEIVMAELDFSLLVAHSKPIPAYVKINPYAVVKLDLTLPLTKKLGYQKIKDISFASSELLTTVKLVSSYKENITLRYYFNSPRKNLTEREAITELNKIKESLK